jgi:hypothetical protein
MEKTREEAQRGITYNNEGRGARGQQDERGNQRATGREGEPEGNRTRGGARGQQDKRGNQRATGREEEPRGKNKERRKLRDKEEVHR